MSKEDKIKVMIAIVVFIVFIACDMQRIKYLQIVGEDEINDKYAILGAFTLYLDFINLFIDLLRLFKKATD